MFAARVAPQTPQVSTSQTPPWAAGFLFCATGPQKQRVTDVRAVLGWRQFFMKMIVSFCRISRRQPHHNPPLTARKKKKIGRRTISRFARDSCPIRERGGAQGGAGAL